MHDSALILVPRTLHKPLPQFRVALRATLAVGCAALALTGCGGGSDSTETPATPPPSTLPAPSNFATGANLSFSWTATPGAGRYELWADSDGPGPQPEALMGETQGFAYSAYNQQLSGSLRLARFTDFINATYRLRACDTSGCGAFTSLQTYDLAKNISHAFPSGHAALKSAAGNSPYSASLSQDGLTLALFGDSATARGVYVFVRSSSAHPWQQQAVWPSGSSLSTLSADGSTLATSGSGTGAGTAAVQIYQRNNGTWGLPVAIDASQAPPACPQPCTVLAGNMALSADGSVLAVTGRSGSMGEANAVFIYTRTATTWTPQAYLAPGATPVGSALALSGNGRTLAVNGGAFTRTDATGTAPYMRIYEQSASGAWSEQADIPAGIVNFLDIAASRYSKAALSADGQTLAVEAQNLPGRQPAGWDIAASDLTCGSAEPWSTGSGWHVALFARDGSTWRRQAVMARGGYWALASDGGAFVYGGALFTRTNGTWACP